MSLDETPSMLHIASLPLTRGLIEDKPATMLQIPDVVLGTIESLVLYSYRSHQAAEVLHRLSKGILAQGNIFHVVPDDTDIRAHCEPSSDDAGYDYNKLDEVPIVVQPVDHPTEELTGVVLTR
jgi:hypothetical protein